MPFNELQRRDSWPPTVVRVRDNDDDYPDSIADTIDENPFAYFLSSPEDFDDGIEDLSAGIESLDVPKPPVRTISPSSLQRVQAHSSDEDDDEDDEEDDVVFGVAMPLSLRDFTRAHRKKREEEELHKSFREHRARPRHTSQPTNNPRRGRATIRLAPPRGAGRGRGYTRSLSARRPRSWREPSPDITSIEEVSESGSDKGDDKAKEGDGSENETKVSPNAESEAQDIPSPKPTKHVHWAF